LDLRTQTPVSLVGVPLEAGGIYWGFRGFQKVAINQALNWCIAFVARYGFVIK